MPASQDRFYIEAAQAAMNAKDDDHDQETAILRNLVKKYPHCITQAKKILLAESLGDGYDEAEASPRREPRRKIAILGRGAEGSAQRLGGGTTIGFTRLNLGIIRELAIKSAGVLASLACRPPGAHGAHAWAYLLSRRRLCDSGALVYRINGSR